VGKETMWAFPIPLDTSGRFLGRLGQRVES
jgi:hypothetical protein